MLFKSAISNIVMKKMQKKLNNATIDEESIKDVLREIRISLLDADVNLDVTKKFIKRIKEQAVGRMVLPDENVDNVILKIIKDELVEILGKETAPIKIEKKPLKIMMVGLQGSGKTTTCGKIALNFKTKHSKKPLLVALDIYRPAAIQQLKTLSEETKVDFYEKGKNKPEKTAKEALDVASKNKNDLIIFDTAGRLQTNKELMDELVAIKKNINPDEILLVVDGMAGQDIINVAQEFNNKLKLTGLIITKLDSDARAGAALSLTSILNVPVKLIGTGEKLTELNVFHPDRIADRILGYGDMITLAEKASENYDEKYMKKSLQKMLSGKMDLEDLMKQMKEFQKMGSMGSIANMLPGGNKISEDKIIDAEKKMKVWEVLLSSMTVEERRNPSLLKRNSNRRNRIIKGSGRKPDELNKLLSQWEKSSKQMEELGKMVKKGQINGLGGLQNMFGQNGIK